MCLNVLEAHLHLTQLRMLSVKLQTAARYLRLANRLEEEGNDNLLNLFKTWRIKQTRYHVVINEL